MCKSNYGRFQESEYGVKIVEEVGIGRRVKMMEAHMFHFIWWA